MNGYTDRNQFATETAAIIAAVSTGPRTTQEVAELIGLDRKKVVANIWYARHKKGDKRLRLDRNTGLIRLNQHRGSSPAPTAPHLGDEPAQPAGELTDEDRYRLQLMEDAKAIRKRYRNAFL
ncbi:hypothetical protein GC209_13925 [bacterium]|nr:hypothetical protein [bacterium]